MKKTLLCLFCITPQLFSADACTPFREFLQSQGADIVPKLALRLMATKLQENEAEAIKLSAEQQDLKIRLNNATDPDVQKRVLEHIQKAPAIKATFFENGSVDPSSPRIKFNFRLWNTNSDRFEDFVSGPSFCNVRLMAKAAEQFGIELGLSYFATQQYDIESGHISYQSCMDTLKHGAHDIKADLLKWAKHDFNAYNGLQARIASLKNESVTMRACLEQLRKQFSSK